MIVSMAESREAQRIAKAQRIAAGRWLQVDESKITSPKDMMLLHRVRAAAADGSGPFVEMLHEPEVNKLFNDGAISIERS